MRSADFKARIATIKSNGDPDDDESFLYMKRNAAPKWALRGPNRGRTPAEQWGDDLDRAKHYRGCDQAIAELENDPAIAHLV